jgi:hypothetical protein
MTNFFLKKVLVERGGNGGKILERPLFYLQTREV